MTTVITVTLCRECQHWEEPQRRRFGFSVDSYPEFGICALMESNDGRPVHQDTLAHAQDSESYNARVYTRPDFGCVMGEPRGGASAP